LSDQTFPVIPINPNIQKTVEWLQAHGFETCDSGDGETHECECDREYGFVAMKVAPEALITEARRLHELLVARGVHITEVNPEDKPCVQAYFDPADGHAILDLMYINDDLMGLNPKSLS
jgi:hypothetical protein